MPVNLSEENPKITEFLAKHHIGILATASSSGAPHAATIYFILDPDFNIYFLTKEETTKFRNLQQNPQAALAVYEAATQTTVQVIGTVTKVDDVGHFQEIFKGVLAVTQETSGSSIPPISQLKAGGYAAFCLKPKVLRMAEYVKAQHTAPDQLFDIVAVPDTTLG